MYCFCKYQTTAAPPEDLTSINSTTGGTSIKSQVTFSNDKMSCDEFSVNKFKLAWATGGFVCLHCSMSFLKHKAEAVTDDHVCMYLAYVQVYTIMDDNVTL